MRYRAAPALIVALSVSAHCAAQSAPAGDLEREHFLRTAEMISAATNPEGSTKSRRVVLRQGAHTHDANVQTVDVRGLSLQGLLAFDLGFIDSYRSLIAAYLLDRLLGIEMTPVSVERSMHGSRSSYTWWVDDTVFNERERLARKIAPPDAQAWDCQVRIMRVFDQLIRNGDRNVGNIVVDRHWKLWMIDHTRAFREEKTLARPADVDRIDRVLFVRIRALKRHAIEARLGPWLSVSQIDALMARRDLIVKRVEQQVRQKGESEVFYDWLREE